MSQPLRRTARSPEDLREEILAFVCALGHPELIDEDGSRFSLASLTPESATAGAVQVRLEVEFGKLLLEIWGVGRSLVRRVESVERKGLRLVLQARKRGAWGPAAGLEILDAADVELRAPATGEPLIARRAGDRDEFERLLVTMLLREYPGLRLERVAHRSDRRHAFSGCYTRGWARRGREAWAFLGLSEFESPAAVENALVYGLIWLDWLREHAGGSQEVVVSGLKLLLPPVAVGVAAHRAAYLSPHAAGIEILEWAPSDEHPRAIDLRDYGNVETRLTPRWRGARLLDECRPLLRELLGPHARRVRVAPDTTGEALSLRILGLDVARIEGGVRPEVFFGVEGERAPLEEAGGTATFHSFLEDVLRTRHPKSRHRTHPYYRLQPERWLESLLIDDLRRVDPALMAQHVYPQVPAFSGSPPCGAGFQPAPGSASRMPAPQQFSRGVIDILGATRDPESGAQRLAVIELKLDEEPNLPLQGLDYWLRVKWLEDRDQFRQHGYFSGLSPSPAPPVIYLVCPAFRFHSTTERVLRYFQPSIRVVKVGVNQRWREGVHVLFRRTLEGGRVIGERKFETPCDDGMSARDLRVHVHAGTPKARRSLD
ncbi:MAG TPA: hypothetical protein VGZ29_12140 [Terriglobia bacterium]|nr:hypothetical protein [Terriglobia bacterium]